MRLRQLKQIGIFGLSAILLTGCAFAGGYSETEQEVVDTMTPSKFQSATRDARNNIATQDTFAQAAFWSREYQLNPADLEASIKLASAVRKMGNPGKAVEITQTTRALYPKDPYLTAEYAAALIASERGGEAIEALDGGLRAAPGYARLWSLKGAALDQMENYDLARKHYARALKITPQDPNVMANLGLSYALAGDPNAAETWLRRAASIPGAGANIQQNLNLVLQLQGKEINIPKSAEARPVRQQSAPRQSQMQSRPQPQARARARAPQRPQMNTHTRAPQGYVPQSGQTASLGHRSNMTVTGNQPGKPRSASDMARAAAQKSSGTGRRVVVPAGAPAPRPEQQDILSQIAGNIGPKPTQAQIQPRQRVPAYAQPYQPKPQQQAQQRPNQAYGNSYPAPAYPTYQNAPQNMQPQRRAPARRR